VLHLNDLRAKMQAPIAPGGQIDHLGRHLRRQAKDVRRRRAVVNDGFGMRSCDAGDDLLDGGRTNAKLLKPAGERLAYRSRPKRFELLTLDS
jgi:hypothetical protein